MNCMFVVMVFLNIGFVMAIIVVWFSSRRVNAAVIVKYGIMFLCEL